MGTTTTSTTTTTTTVSSVTTTTTQGSTSCTPGTFTTVDCNTCVCNSNGQYVGGPLTLHSVLRACCRPVLCFPLHLWRHHLLRLRRVGLWRGAPGQAVVQHQGRLHRHPRERGGQLWF